MSIEPFQIQISDEVLIDLRERLARTRWPDDFANDDWRYGTNTAYLKSLCQYWEKEFDWAAVQEQINQYSHFKTGVEGNPIHFIHERGKGPNPKPLILSHGWPWTFWDFKKVIRPLTDPVAFGGKAEDAFDVVIPSLPGYGFSTPLRQPGINFWRTADMWVDLMEQLAYPRFYAHGNDWGAILTSQLGHKHADRVLGIHLTLPTPLTVLTGKWPADSEFDEDPDKLAKNQHFFGAESGYSAIQATKPQTLTHGINDSPAGLCSWLLEKRRTWSHCEGDVETRFSKDELCAVMTLYWATQSFGTSARYYYECAHNPWKASHDREPTVEAPTALCMFDNEVFAMPRRWCERNYNLKQWTEHASGGHFAPMEEPEVLVADIQKFFRTL